LAKNGSALLSLISLLNGFINLSPNIYPVTKFTAELLPFAFNIIIFFAVKQIHKEKNFNEHKFFRTN